MPEYEIEDTETGLKIPVVGDADPTQEDAHRLIQSEYSDIATNLFRLPDGKMYLNVGPFQQSAQQLDRINSMLYGGNASNQTNKTQPPKKYVESVMEKLPPGSLFIDAHGSQDKPKKMITDWGHEFTMSNLAKVIGDVSGISNIVNAACYGSGCGPEDYEAAFPKAAKIRHTNTNYSNITSMNDNMSGVFFQNKKAVDQFRNPVEMETRWEKKGGKWNLYDKRNAMLEAVRSSEK